ncbi:MAG: alpha/beta fold hydrolase [Natronospirillum sp.]
MTFRFGQRALRWGTQGIPVLAVHGWQGHPDQFRAIACALVGQGYQVFALNGPGHGGDLNGPVHPGLIAEYIEDVVAELGGVQAVIGHSMGGGTAMMAMAAGVPVRQAVIISAPYSFSSVALRTAERLGLSGRAKARFMARMEKRAGYSFQSLNGDHLLPEVDVPVLVVHDEGDRQVSFLDAERIAQRVPIGTLYATQGFGHGRILQSDEVVVRIVEFLCHGR